MAHPASPWLCALALLGGCVREVKLDEQLLRLPEGRVAGPIEIRLPRRADHGLHDLKVEVTFQGRCEPRFELEFPDGEREEVGPWFQGRADKEWQELLSRRAQGEDAAAQRPQIAPPPPPPPPAPQVSGSYQPVLTERWPGQLRFLALREERCGGPPVTYRATHYIGYEEHDRLTLFAKVPQEVEGGQLRVRTWELVPVPAPPPPGATPPQRRAAPAPAVRVAAIAPPVKLPGRPPSPKREAPGAPKVPGARFIPGQWVWQESTGHWEWSPGYWDAPSQTPALLTEDPGPPRIAGSVWRRGHWVWVRGDGQWSWIPGRWEMPPPRPESPGRPPVVGAPWLPGQWIIVDAAYVWLPGHFGAAPLPARPARLAETPPPPPYRGARFIPGDWVWSDDRWRWVKGAYERADRPPPPPRAEAPPPPPAPGAVWLRGYHRWQEERADYAWIPGHWELPPGEGYVFVPDPSPGRGQGAVSFGHWELRVTIPLRQR